MKEKPFWNSNPINLEIKANLKSMNNQKVFDNNPFALSHSGGISASTVEPHAKRYCSYCGIQMIETMHGAETNHVSYGPECGTMRLASPYDEKTGQRNYCYKYTCSKWKKKCWGLFYSDHDNYFIDEVIKV